MRRLMMMAGAFGVALVMSSGAFAQVPPDPNNPNEKVPEKMISAMPYGEPITSGDGQEGRGRRDPRKRSKRAMGHVRRRRRPERRSHLFRKNG